MDYQYIGKLNIEPLEEEFGSLTTVELILTQERDEHKKDHHEADYKLFHKCVFDVIKVPDLILKDAKNKNTVMYIKYIEETNVNIVIRLSLETIRIGINPPNTFLLAWPYFYSCQHHPRKNAVPASARQSEEPYVNHPLQR